MAKVLPVREITHASMHELVYQELRHAIMTGKFEPGQKLSLRGLASAFKTSEMPVRAAVQRLVSEGGMVQRPNGTFAITAFTREAFEEVMDLRMLLEPRATELACPHIPARTLKELAASVRRMQAAIDRADTAAYLDDNQKFKFTVYGFCPSPMLVDIIQNLWLKVGSFLRHLAPAVADASASDFHTDHIQAALDALQERDAAAAAEALRQDIRQGLQTVLFANGLVNGKG